jgi:hypothetical protein
MKSIKKISILAALVLGMVTGAYAQDLFTVTETVSEGLNGSLMVVTPSGSALANAAVVILGGTLDDSALTMMPFTGGGANGGGFNPGNGLTTNFNQTGVADAFAYGTGPFLFPAGSPGDVPQGVPGGPAGPTPPGGGSIASTPTNEFQQIDQVVGKFTASSGFVQNFYSIVQRPALATDNNGSRGLFTLEQGDSDMEGLGTANTGEDRQVFKQQVLHMNGVAFDPDVVQLVQQEIGGVGPFSSCMNCFPGNVIGVSGDTPLGTYPNGQEGGQQVLVNAALTFTFGFSPDSVTHPGP